MNVKISPDISRGNREALPYEYYENKTTLFRYLYDCCCFSDAPAIAVCCQSEKEPAGEDPCHDGIAASIGVNDKFETKSPTDESKPTDTKDYRETLLQTKDTVQSPNSLIKSMNLMLNSSGWEKLPTQLSETLNRIEEESEEVVDHTFRQAILLILIWLFAHVAARLIYQYLSKRLFGSSAPGSATSG